MIIGITGIFGSGKTTAAKLFVKHGYKHINADEIGHLILNKNPTKDKVIQAFGKTILTAGKIDRKKLKNIVFNDNSKLIRLNRIIHPAIINEIKSSINKSRNKNIIVDGALLIEVGFLEAFDKLIVVKIDEKEQLKRALKKGKYTKKEIKNILKSQLSQKEKLKYADYVIDNSESKKELSGQVSKIVSAL